MWRIETVHAAQQLSLIVLGPGVNPICPSGSHHMGIEFPGGERPIERRAFWSAEFESILAVSVISRQDMIYVGEQVLEMATGIIGLIDASLARA